MVENCVLCQRLLDRRVGALSGGSVCHSCYQATFLPVSCAGCSGAIRSHLGQVPVYCRVCRSKAGEQCLRCTRPVAKRSFTTADGKVCAYCRRYVEPTRPCPCCGRESRHFESNKAAGVLTAVCTRCARKSHETCSQCGKYRAVAGRDEHQKPLCPSCLSHRPFCCPQCQSPGPQHSRKECLACYRLRSTQEEAIALAQAVPPGWARQAFETFVGSWIASHTLTGHCRPRLRRYARFFVGLSTQFESLESITAERLLTELEPDELRRHRVPYTWLCTQQGQATVSADLASARTEELTQIRLLARVQEPWKKTLLEQFLRYLGTHQAAWRRRGWDGEHERFANRTVTLVLRAAWRFLGSLDADIQSVQAIDVCSLEAFIAAVPGHRNALHSFVGYLNRNTVQFEALHIDRSGDVRNFAYHYLLTPERSQELTNRWLQAPDTALRNALLGLMMLVYARTAKQACSLKRGDFILGPRGQVSARFGAVAVEIAPSIANLFRRYLETREQGRQAALAPDEYLFTGNAPGRHFGGAGLQHVLVQEGVTARQLYTTALSNFFRAQLRSPKVLVRTLGITDQTAVKYWQAFCPRINDEMRFMALVAKPVEVAAKTKKGSW